MMNDKQKITIAVAITVLVACTGFVVLFYFFNHLHNSRFVGDLGAHFLTGLGECLNWGNDPPHWLFFQLVRWAYQASGSRVFAYNVFLGLVAAATMFKYVFFVFHKGLRPVSQSTSWFDINRHFLAVGLLFCAVIPVVSGFSDAMFLGYISPTCWNNATCIVSIPLAVLLFYGTILFIEKRKTGWLWITLIIFLEVILIHVKPSYTLAYIPGISLVTLVFFLSNRIDRAELVKYFLIVVVGIIALAERKLSLGDSDIGSLRILPFSVWLNFVDNDPLKLVLALLSSVALPLVYLVECKLKNQRLSLLFIFASLVLAIAVLQYLFLAERGVNTFYQNLIGQSMTASSIIHIVIVQESYEKKNVFTLGYFAIMVVIGLNWFRFLALG